jgi:transcriptional regulator with XRE-family HTH domain
MKTELGEFIQRERKQRALTLQALAREIGYRNRDKGARRIERLEQSGREADDLVTRVIGALGLDVARAAELRSRDEVARKTAFEKWVQDPQPMKLLQMVVGITIEVALPEGLTEAQAVDFAVSTAKKGARLCLVLDRRRSLWITPEGKTTLTLTPPDHPNFPYTTVG